MLSRLVPFACRTNTAESFTSIFLLIRGTEISHQRITPSTTVTPKPHFTRLSGPHMLMPGTTHVPRSLSESDLHTLLWGSLPQLEWMQYPTITCRIMTAHPPHTPFEVEFDIPQNILMWQFEEAMYHHNQSYLKVIREAIRRGRQRFQAALSLQDLLCKPATRSISNTSSTLQTR